MRGDASLFMCADAVSNRHLEGTASDWQTGVSRFAARGLGK
jgi:hypothetical protein